VGSRRRVRCCVSRWPRSCTAHTTTST